MFSTVRKGFQTIYVFFCWLLSRILFQSKDQSLADATTQQQHSYLKPIDAASLEWSVKRVLDNEMLSDTEIFAALSILRNQFRFMTSLKGFHDPQTFNARFIKNPFKILSSPSTDKFVQILHDGHAHWITITNLGTQPGQKHIRIFDSLFNKTTYEQNNALNNFLKRLYESKNLDSNDLIVLDNENEPIKCIVESVQVQSDTALCGLFAIAFAYDLCAGLRDPCGEYYNEEKMRKHLFRCLSDGEFTEFPKLYENEEDKCERSVRREFEIFI